MGPFWFSFEWPRQLSSSSIQVKELLPVVAAAALYGKYWTVVFSVDNQAVVSITNSNHSREAHLMHLVRLLVFYACHYNFWFRAEHIPGKKNTLADALSRNNVSYFLSQVPQVSHYPSKVPRPLLALLSLKVALTSTPWMELVRRSLLLD